MNLLDQIAEARIQAAIDQGELRDLPGQGKPLQLDDDSAIPEELRVAYRILKNAGFLPRNYSCAKKSAVPNSCLGNYRRVNGVAHAHGWNCCNYAWPPAAVNRSTCCWKTVTARGCWGD
ncbi:hypothetical protein BN873_610074 [Candidatus Competibacter denitrificans Run_A_D11]|uniref:DnaJ homologue subfamily C member 28 conserved domain-containing protein n=1 Tax=Candidatus Competibacter denitrificans Run_A_D11 TaxID=1400863 RepID=W6M7Q5_9GAMM|nr:hypothetical protein BN873_610074 [Candidatus Competibacter denitrificans Run_A_D11]